MTGEERAQFEKQVQALVTGGHNPTAFELAEFFWQAGRQYQVSHNVLTSFDPYDPKQMENVLALASGLAMEFEQDHSSLCQTIYGMDGHVGYVPTPVPWPMVKFRFNTEGLFTFVQMILRRFHGE